MYRSSQMYKTGWKSKRAISSKAKVGGSEQLSLEGPIKDSVSVSFQQHEQHVFDIPVSCFNFPETFDSQTLLCQSSGDNNLTKRTEQAGSTPQFRNSLQTVVDSFMSSDEDTFCETYSELPCDNVPLYEHFTQEHAKLVGDDAAPVGRPLSNSSQRNQAEVACVTSGNSASSTVPTGKKRIRWTKDMHERFVTVVNSLGGPQKAKPKAVLQMMDSNVLTIFHVKSHLQKYRTTMYVQNTFEERSVERQGRDGVTELQLKIHMQIEESRQLQLEVRRSIQEQLEMQRNLLLLVEQQKKQLL